MTRWGRSDSGISLREHLFTRKPGIGADFYRAATSHMTGFVEYLLHRTSSGALLARSLPVTAIAATGGVVFSLGVAAAIAPSGSDSAPRLAATTSPVIHVAALDTAPSLDETASVQAALLSLPADTSVITGSLTTSAPTATQDDPATDGLRGSLSTDPVADINASFDAEQADTKTAELLGPPTPVSQTVTLEIKSGDTIGRVLADLGVPGDDARAAANALAEHFSPRELKIGQALEVELETLPVEVAALEELDLEAPTPSLVAFNLKADRERSLRVTYNAETSTFESQEIFRELTKEIVRAKGSIEGSLFGSAAKLGVPNAVMVNFMKLYSYSVDFQREIRKGDTFEVYYTQYNDEDGERVKTGDILFASLQTGKKPMTLWRFEIPGEDTVDYFDESGRSTKKFLMRTPIDGARISSNFGKRRHPILGYTKMHTGTDFAAPTGTPIYAAGNGTIVKAGWQGGYGKYVKIRHANGYETAYAHMSRIGKGITPGARVTQGQTIGRVGTTGRSTGPHLHYEVHVKGKKVNPMAIRVPTGRKLEGKALNAFKAARDGMNAEMAQVEPLKPAIESASTATPDENNSVE
ncbi:peptidoglycan DD-metalloendopeptidase family protein [Pyruvatibacter sp.]